MGKLIYQYIHKVGNIEKQFILYSHNYDVEYDEKNNTLKIKKQEDVLGGFYGKSVDEISLVVGKNGVGKTTILELFSLDDEKYNKRFQSLYYSDMSWFVVYELRDNKFIVEGTGKFFNSTENDISRKYKKGHIDEEGLFCEETQDVKMDELTTIIFRPIEMIMNNNFHEPKAQKNKRLFVDASANEMCEFLLDKYEKYSECMVPNGHNIQIIQDEPGIDCTLEKEYSDKEIFLIGLLAHTLMRIEDYSKGSKDLNKLKKIWELEKKCIYSEDINVATTEDIESLFNDDYYLGVGRGLEKKYSDKYLERLDTEVKTMYENYLKKRKQEYISDTSDEADKEYLLDEIISFYADRSNDYAQIPEEYFITKKIIQIPIAEENKKFFNVLRYSRMYSFKSYLYQNNSIIEPVLRTEISSLSTGEIAFVKLFAGFLANKDENRFSIICLDEPDNYMHPEWSRMFIKSLIEYLESLGGDYQIIITTHSPLMTSDMLKRNIWCIDYDGKIKNSKSGWMNNIHNAYIDSFYLKSTFGEFGKNVI